MRALRRPLLSAAALAALAALLPAQPPAPAPAPAVPDGVTLFASLNVAEVWGHRAAAPLREARGKLEFAWAVQALVGLTPEEMEKVALVWHPSVPDLPYTVVTGRKALDPAAVAKTLSRPGSPPKAFGKAVPVTGSEFAYAYPADAKTVLLAPAGAEAAAIEKVAALLPDVAKVGAGHALAVGVNVAALAGLPLPVGGPLLEARTATLTVDLKGDAAEVKLVAAYPTDAAAKAAMPILAAKFQELAGYAKAQEKRAEGREIEAGIYPGPLFEFVAKTMTGATVRTDGPALIGTAEVKLDDAVGSVLAALPDAALAPRGPSPAMNNLKQIALGVHSYHDVHGHCPANIYDKDGKALLSWRVQILPYIEQVAVHQKFKLDEAWDSAANKEVSKTVIRTFQIPGRPAPQPWETYFRSFTSPKDAGEHAAWLTDGEKKGPGLVRIIDGTSNTIMVAEAAEAVPWAKPDDLPYDGKLPLPRLGGPGGTFAVVFGDGSARTFRRAAIPEMTLRAAITIGGGEVVNFPD